MNIHRKINISLRKLSLKKLSLAVVFPAGPNKKKEKIGTIFCPKGGLAVVF
jgi:hypothetical protein